MSTFGQYSSLSGGGGGGGGGTVETVSSDVLDVTGTSDIVLSFRPEFNAVQGGPTITLDFATNGPNQRVDLSANLAITLSGMVSGGRYILQLAQSASPSAVTYTNTIYWGNLGVPDLSALAHDAWITIEFYVNTYGYISASYVNNYGPP